MLKSQKLEIRSAEIRSRLSELAGKDSLSEEESTELRAKTAELRQVESQRVATLEVEALEAEERKTEIREGGEIDPEERERRKVLGKARLGNALRAVIEGRPFSGAELELRTAYGFSGDHEVPLELFEPRGEERAQTDPPGTTGVGMRPVQPYLYAQGVAGFLGIDMPQIGSGTPAFPVLTTKTPAGMKAKGAAADETAAAFTVTTASPKRATGSFRVRVEDMAVFPELEDALRRDIPASLADSVEDQILNGDGNSPNITGLFTRLTDPSVPGSKSGQQDYVAAAADALEGIHGTTLRDVRLLVGPTTYSKMAAAFFTNTAVSTAAWYGENTGGLRLSNRIADPVSSVQQAVIRIGMRPMVAVVPVWGGVSLIRDMYSGAAKGEIVVTAHQLLGDVHLLRAEAFKQVSFQP